MESHQKNHTWDLVTLSHGRKVVTCKWIYKLKEGQSPEEGVKSKSRVVARGFSQRESVDYYEIFSPVVRKTSIRVLVAIVVQPEGFLVSGKEDNVCKLRKSLYGLKQSPRQWYKRVDSYMVKLSYDMSPYDFCVYMSKVEDGSYIDLVLYVDDMLIAAKKKCDISETERATEF